MIRGKTLRLRALGDEDLPHLMRFTRDRAVTRHQVSFRLPLSEDDERAFIRKVRRSPTDRVYAVESLRGRFIGCVGLHRIEAIDRSCEIGVLIADPRQWGRGYAAEAARLGMVVGFERLHLNRLEAPVLATNRVACSMYAGLGFIEEGRLRERRWMDGRWVDVVLFATLARDYRPKENWRALGANEAKLRRLPARLS